MSTRFDDEVQASWGQFEAQVALALADIGDDGFSIDLEGETDESGAFPYFQFIGYDDMIRAEVAGNDVLDPAYRMNVDQENALVAIGWQRPCDVESPNWWLDVTREQVDVVLTMVTAAFRQVFGDVHPKFLVSDRLASSDATEDDGPEACAGPAPGADEDAVPVMGFPDNYNELVSLVCRALASIYGDDLVRDDDGDFSIGILNRRQDFLEFVLADGIITASFDLPAAPFVGPQLLWMIAQVAKQLDDLAGDTAVRVGGKLWLDESLTLRSDSEESS